MLSPPSQCFRQTFSQAIRATPDVPPHSVRHIILLEVWIKYCGTFPVRKRKQGIADKTNLLIRIRRPGMERHKPFHPVQNFHFHYHNLKDGFGRWFLANWSSEILEVRVCQIELQIALQQGISAQWHNLATCQYQLSNQIALDLNKLRLLFCWIMCSRDMLLLMLKCDFLLA